MRLIYIETLTSYFIEISINEKPIFCCRFAKKRKWKDFFFFFAADFEVATSS